MPDTWWVTGVWYDGAPWATHVTTDDIDRTRMVDENQAILSRTWTTWVVCTDIWTCDHRANRRPIPTVTS